MSAAITFIVHGRLRNTRYLTALQTKFPQSANNYYYTVNRGDGIELSVRAVKEAAPIIIAVGGDGTLNEVVNGVLRADSQHPRPIIGVLPCGSGNDVARYFKMNQSVNELRARVNRCAMRRLDVLQLRYTNIHGNSEERYCFNVADAGLGGLVAQLVTTKPQWMNASLKYFLSVVQGFAKYERRDISVWFDGEEWSGKAMSVCLANFAYFGSGMGIAPHAVSDDGLAAMTIIGDVTILDYFRLTPALRRSEFLRHPQIFYKQARVCRIESDSPLPVEIDGEFVGMTPVEMMVLPGEILFLV